MRKFLLSFFHAWNGLRRASKERNLRIHFAAAGGVVLAGWLWQLQIWEWAVLMLAVGLVLTAEVINTAVEELANVVRDENKLHYHATRHTRDMAAGAVLLASLFAAIVGVIVFLPHW